MLAEGYVPRLIKLLEVERYHTQAHDCFKELLYYSEYRSNRLCAVVQSISHIIQFF